MAPSNLARCKVQVKLALQRLRMVVAKMEAGAKVSRREIATLIEKGRIETARIRVENIISDDVHIELLEIMELYCEILSARINLMDISQGVDPGIADAVAGIVYAAPRTEVKELNQLREILMSRYGRDYAIQVMENRDNVVPLRVTSKINLPTPDPKLVELYLNEIAKAYTLPLPFKTSEPVPSTGLRVSDPPPPFDIETISQRDTTSSTLPKPSERTRRRTVSFKELTTDSSEPTGRQLDHDSSKLTTPPDGDIPRRDVNHSGGSTVRSFSTAHSRASTFADVPEELDSVEVTNESDDVDQADLNTEVNSLIQDTQRHLDSEPLRDLNFDELTERLAALKGLA